MTPCFWPDKDPSETLDYRINWFPTLRTDSDDRVVSSSWQFPEGLTMGSSDHGDTWTTVWISGGEDGETYPVTNVVTTSGGRTMRQVVKIRVRTFE